MNLSAIKNKHPILAKLIFNPGSGVTSDSPVQLMDVISEMQAWNILPEAFLIEPDCDLPGMIREALEQGIRLFVVCGGDSSIAAVARSLVGTHATLGIIPMGTKNNTALSLGIPNDIPLSIAILRTGQRVKIDMGMIFCGETSTPFLEMCSVGLISTLYPSADDIQHGNLARIGDFVNSLVSSPAAEIHLLLDGKQNIHGFGHVLLVSNMPFIGLNYQVGTLSSFNDGLLDVLFFGDLSKLDLLGYVFQGVGIGEMNDTRIQRFHVRKVDIDSDPVMQVMADGILLGEGAVKIKIKRHALAVMVKQAPFEVPGAKDVSLE